MPLDKVPIPEGRTLVEGMADGGFIIGGVRLDGGFVIWPEGVQPIERRRVGELGEGDFELLLNLTPLRDVLLIGSGPAMRWPDFGLLEALRGRVAGVDVMESRAAARTFNLLVGEERLVGALILPLRP